MAEKIEWSDADKNHVARLVRKYGRAEVIARAEQTPRSKPRGNRRDAALAAAAEWVEARMEEGVSLKKATAEWAARENPNSRSGKAFEDFRESVKNKLEKWRRDDRKVKAGRELADEQGRLGRPTKSSRN